MVNFSQTIGIHRCNIRHKNLRTIPTKYKVVGTALINDAKFLLEYYHMTRSEMIVDALRGLFPILGSIPRVWFIGAGSFPEQQLVIELIPF